MMGDAIPRPLNDRLTVTVRVVDGTGLVVELHGASGCMARYPVESADQVFTPALDVSGTPYVRAQLVSGDRSAEMHALTSPIYLT
jgi:hypothetical protein